MYIHSWKDPTIRIVPGATYSFTPTLRMVWIHEAYPENIFITGYEHKTILFDELILIWKISIKLEFVSTVLSSIL